MTTIEFCIFELVQVSSFTLTWQLWLPGPNFPKKSISGLERKSDCHLWILHVRISLEVKFHLNWQCWLFGPNMPEKGISNWKRKKWTASLNSTYSNEATIIFIIFWDFLLFYQTFFSPQVKRCAIITDKHGI